MKVINRSQFAADQACRFVGIGLPPSRASILPGDRADAQPRANLGRLGCAAAGDHSPAASIPISDAVASILALVAAHDGRSAEDVIARLVCERAEQIGLSVLLETSGGPDGDELASGEPDVVGAPNFRADVARYGTTLEMRT